MSDAWQAGLFYAPPVLYGRKLRPFSLAHGLALKTLDSPYMRDAEATPADLYVAIQVCIRSYAELRAGLLGVVDGTRMALWYYAGGRRKFKTADASLRTYMRDCVDAAPRTTVDKAAAKRLACQLELHLARCLCAEWGYTFESAMDTSYALACALCDVVAEREGDQSLIDAGKEKIADAMAEAYKAHAAGDEATERRWYEEAERLAAEYRGES